MRFLMIILLAVGVLTAVAAPVNAADNSQQQRMKDCNRQATGMTGDTRKSFMSSCLSGEAAQSGFVRVLFSAAKLEFRHVITELR